jgi:hypothetical protein
VRPQIPGPAIQRRHEVPATRGGVPRLTPLGSERRGIGGPTERPIGTADVG